MAPHRILIVEDHSLSTQSIGMLRRHRGHETRVALTGRDAHATAAGFNKFTGKPAHFDHLREWLLNRVRPEVAVAVEPRPKCSVFNSPWKPIADMEAWARLILARYHQPRVIVVLQMDPRFETVRAADEFKRMSPAGRLKSNVT